MIRKAISILTICAFIAVSVITLIALVSHASCLAHTLNGGMCSIPNKTILFFNFLSSTFSGLSLAIVSYLFLFFSIKRLAFNVTGPKQKVFSWFVKKHIFALRLALKQLQAWISILELSPSYIR